MSLFDLNPVESEQQYNNAALNPLNPADIGARWYEGVGTGLVQGGKTAFYRDLFNVGKATKDEPTAQRALTNLEQLKPNPETVGVVGQLMFGLTDTLGTLAYNFAGGNVTPQTMAQSAGTSYAGSQEALHIKEGMDPKTARSVGIIEGAGVGLGAVVPGNVAGGLVMRATSGAAINLVMGAGQRALIQNELNKAGHAEMAKQYAPFDGVQSATDLAIGAFFGGLLGERPRKLTTGPGKTTPGGDIHIEPPMHGFVSAETMTMMAQERLTELQTKRDGTEDTTITGPDGEPMVLPGKQKEFLTDAEKHEIALLEKLQNDPQALAHAYGFGIGQDLKPSDIDTVLTQNNAAHVELGTAPGVPTDLATRQAHVDMVSQAIKDLQEGNPVQATPDVTNGNFMENPGAVATRNAIGEAVNEHLSDLDLLQKKLEERGLPGDPNLYSITPLEMPPVRVTSDVRSIIERATRENWSTEKMISEVEALLGKLEDRNAARSAPKDRVRGTLWIEERLTRAERTGELSPEQVRLAKWLLAKNPAIGNDLAISLRTSKADGVGGMYNPIARLALLFKGGGDELTAAHEILHHTERMMPEDIQREIRLAWLAEVKRVRDVAERSGNENLALFINDVIKANLGMQANAENALNAIKQGLVNKDAYALFNPSEFWAVNGSKILRERASESWVQRAAQWLREFMEKAKDLFGLPSDAAVIRGLDAVLKSEGYKSDANLTDNFLPRFAQPDSNFMRWFGKSKVVDKDGKPLVVYHGSPDMRWVKESGVFSTMKERMLKFGATPESKKAAIAERGYFFTDAAAVAKTYADPRRAFDYQAAEEGTIPVYLSIKKPKEVDAKGLHWREAQALISKDNFIAQAKSEGYDGVIIKNVRDSYDSRTTGKDPKSNVYVAFDPTQIKHAELNNGDYSTTNPNMLMSVEGPKSGKADAVRNQINDLRGQLEAMGEVTALPKKQRIQAQDLNNQIIDLEKSVADIEKQEAQSLTDPQAAQRDPYSIETLLDAAPNLTIPTEDGTMVLARDALARADDEIATAQRDAQGYGAAVACALRG